MWRSVGDVRTGGAGPAIPLGHEAVSGASDLSGAFKNALDWLHVLGSRQPPFLHDKVIELINEATRHLPVKRFPTGA